MQLVMYLKRLDRQSLLNTLTVLGRKGTTTTKKNSGGCQKVAEKSSSPAVAVTRDK